jgi:hypothetical protein
MAKYRNWERERLDKRTTKVAGPLTMRSSEGRRYFLTDLCKLLSSDTNQQNRMISECHVLQELVGQLASEWESFSVQLMMGLEWAGWADGVNGCFTCTYLEVRMAWRWNPWRVEREEPEMGDNPWIGPD